MIFIAAAIFLKNTNTLKLSATAKPVHSSLKLRKKKKSWELTVNEHPTYFFLF